MKTESNKSSVEETERVVIVIRKGCGACEDVVQRVSREMETFHQKPRIINLDQGLPAPSRYHTVITPAIYIDRELWAYGTVSRQIIASKLKHSLGTAGVFSNNPKNRNKHQGETS